MTHLQTITRAYDECGIVYVILDNNGYQYLYLTGTEQRSREFTYLGVERLHGEDFIEFYPDGSIASY